MRLAFVFGKRLFKTLSWRKTKREERQVFCLCRLAELKETLRWKLLLLSLSLGQVTAVAGRGTAVRTIHPEVRLTLIR